MHGGVPYVPAEDDLSQSLHKVRRFRSVATRISVQQASRSPSSATGLARRAVIDAMCIAVTLVTLPTGVVRAADNPLLGLYAGGSIGRSDVHLDQAWTGSPPQGTEIVGHPSGWTASIGIRPIRFLGAELQYLDFGNVHYNRPFAVSTAFYEGGNLAYALSFPGSAAVHTDAEALAALFYAPIPVRFVDVYAKLGAADWHTAVNGEFNSGPDKEGLPCGCVVRDLIALNETRTDLIYGAGMQFKFGPLALRTEYERLNSKPEYPYMYLIGLTWTF